MPDPTTLIAGLIAILTTGSAAGAFYKVLQWITGDKPKLHSHSEVTGLQTQIADLKEANEALREANATANATLSALIQAGRTGHAAH